MIVKENILPDFSDEFEVFCYNCRNGIIVDSTDDLEKEYIKPGVLIYVKCPTCGHNIIIKTRFEDFSKFNITEDLLSRIKTKQI